MNPNLTEIAFVLDRSGSMESMVDAAIAGFNNLLHQQQQEPGGANFTLVLFDDLYEVPIQSLPIAEVIELDRNSYVPRGSTALLDALGRTIDELGEKLANTPEPARPAQVIVAVLTDGMENASVKYGWNDISQRIRHQTETYQWKFLFLGANQDAIATAGRMNIQARDSANFSMDAKSVHAAQSAIHRKMSALRRSQQGIASDEVMQDLIKPMDAIREEEEQK